MLVEIINYYILTILSRPYHIQDNISIHIHC
jgi:hypothetical protein